MKYFKLNQTVYHYNHGKGVVISVENTSPYSIVVKFKFNTISFTKDGKQFETSLITLSQNPIPKIVNVPLEEEYVPFTFEDNLLRKQVISKDKSIKGVITYQDIKKVLIGDYTESYRVLFQDYTFVDGKPCGKLG
jgi:hypothetical protein